MRREMRVAWRALLLGAALALTRSALQAQPEIRGHVTVNVHRVRLLTSIPAGTPTAFMSSAGGIEGVAFLPSRRLGAQFQLLSASRAAANSGKLSAMGVSVLYGSSERALEGGLSRRRGYSVGTGRNLDASHTHFRLGGLARTPLGGDGFDIGIRGSLYLAADLKTRGGVSGWDAGTDVRWTSAQRPLTASLGFRRERFLVASVDQEATAVTVGVGYLFGGGQRRP